jgi:hypothetical protein
VQNGVVAGERGKRVNKVIMGILGVAMFLCVDVMAWAIFSRSFDDNEDYETEEKNRT